MTVRQQQKRTVVLLLLPNLVKMGNDALQRQLAVPGILHPAIRSLLVGCAVTLWIAAASNGYTINSSSVVARSTLGAHSLRAARGSCLIRLLHGIVRAWDRAGARAAQQMDGWHG